MWLWVSRLAGLWALVILVEFVARCFMFVLSGVCEFDLPVGFVVRVWFDLLVLGLPRTVALPASCWFVLIV